MQEMDIETWYSVFSEEWQQGEHVVLIGPTGTGKTTVAQNVLNNREWVCVLAVKRHDDTLDRFRNGYKYGHPPYRVIQEWPPDYGHQRVILWKKPESLSDPRQVETVYKALNMMYNCGGWCIYFDEAGYISGNLGMAAALGTLLNQGRSAYISVVCTITRPSSIVARVPKETLSMPRHKLIFKFTNEDEMKTCAAIAGLPPRDMLQLMQQLEFHKAPSGNRYSDFVYVGYDSPVIVRSTASTS